MVPLFFSNGGVFPIMMALSVGLIFSASAFAFISEAGVWLLVSYSSIEMSLGRVFGMPLVIMV